MAKAKTSRKGKKAWRKNIDSAEHDAFVETSAKEARVGGPLDQLSNDALFFVDKEKDLAVERKVDKIRKKGPLHCESILARSSLVAPVRWSERRKDTKMNSTQNALTAGEESKKQVAAKYGDERVLDIWGDISAPPSKRAKRSSVVAPAVEVDIPGCSYNPDQDEHQDALAKAVATEMQKQYARELEPTAPKLPSNGLEMDEEERFFLDVDEAPGTSDGEGEPTEDGAEGVVTRASSRGKLTRVDLNRRLRRLQQEAEEAKRKEIKKLRADLEKLEQIMGDVEEEQREKELRRLRKKIAAAERAAAAPPRLGKHKFQPEPVRMLLSDELTGSLRKLKAYPALAKDRFKSLQRRGLIEPRIASRGRKGSIRRATYEQGTKGDKEREMHAEMLARKALRQKGGEIQEVH